MNFYKIAAASLVHSKNAVFTYHSAENLPLGTLVRVSLGRAHTNGVVLEKCSKPSFTTKEISKVLYPQSVLPTELLRLSQWISDYYAAHLSLVLQNMLPSGIHKQRRDNKTKLPTAQRLKKDITLTSDQQRAVQSILQTDDSAYLLHGAPGSGKTEVYIAVCKEVIHQNKSAIILVPEIALTAQLIAEFANHFPNVIVMHSGMTESQRHQNWEKILQSTEPLVVVGPRSALFSPVKNVGIIIIDECHEQSFKQDRMPRYHAIYAARMLAKAHRAKIVLGSATPGVNEFYLARQGRLTLLEMPRPIQEQYNDTMIVSHKDRSAFSRHRFFSRQLIESIEYSLAHGEQALLFHNRRGTTPAVICETCGWQASCPHCELPLTFHGDELVLRCHACNFTTPVVRVCPECKSPTILFKGIGTKLIVAELTKLFPKARIARFDADTAKEEQVHSRYQELYDGTIDLLVGTQVIAKGLDLPKVSTVGILQADAGLHLPDFTAAERTFQLLYQASGRAGRAAKAGRVIIQTYLPDNPYIAWAAAHDYQSFYQAEIVHRQHGMYPPITYLLKMSYSAVGEATAIRAAKKMAQSLKADYPKLHILGPTPAFHEQSHGKHHWQLILKSPHRHELQQIARDLPSSWQFDIDPVSLL